jgi:hypothetical protein
MDTLAEMRCHLIEDVPYVLRGSIPLYILAEKKPRPDGSTGLLVASNMVGEVWGTLIYLSPLDAAIDGERMNRQGRDFQVRPLESFDPRNNIVADGGFMTLDFVSDFLASGNELIPDENNALRPNAYRVHMLVREEDLQEPPIQFDFDDDMVDLFNDLHRKAGIRDYYQISLDMARETPMALVGMAREALKKARRAKSATLPTQHGVFDPVDMRWRFAERIEKEDRKISNLN